MIASLWKGRLKLKIRRYKNYTVVYVEEISLNEFNTSIKKYNDLRQSEKYMVIRPTKKAIEKFTHAHPLTLSECKKGKTYKFLGLHFEVVEIKNNLITFSYIGRNEKKELFTSFIASTVPVARVLIETLYHQITGQLLYF